MIPRAPPAPTVNPYWPAIHSSLPSHTLPFNDVRTTYRGAATGQPTITGTIPSSTPLRPVNIALRSFATPSNPIDGHSASLLESTIEKQGTRHSFDSAGSDFSLWSDTGDLAEQLADEEDPLRIKLRDSVDGELWGASGSRPRPRQPKRVHYLHQSHIERKTTNPGVDKEAIEIPEPVSRYISRAEKLIAIVMTRDREQSQMHGLTGKPLL